MVRKEVPPMGYRFAAYENGITVYVREKDITIYTPDGRKIFGKDVRK